VCGRMAGWWCNPDLGASTPSIQGAHNGRAKGQCVCSGSGLHVGHPEGYTATDIIARFKRMNGCNVLHPMGWDAFGLPAEQYALQTGTHPRATTEKNINRFRQQLKSLGFSYDWSREIATTEPAYYKWTQWIFTKLLERNLAYQAEVSTLHMCRLLCPASPRYLQRVHPVHVRVGASGDIDCLQQLRTGLDFMNA
jgi:hypothetical protein